MSHEKIIENAAWAKVKYNTRNIENNYIVTGNNKYNIAWHFLSILVTTDQLCTWLNKRILYKFCPVSCHLLIVHSGYFVISKSLQ